MDRTPIQSDSRRVRREDPSRPAGERLEETYELDAAGWEAIPCGPFAACGYRYRGPTGLDGDPVRMVVLKLTGIASLKVLLQGSLGTQPLGVVPPNPGTDATVILTIPGAVHTARPTWTRGGHRGEGHGDPAEGREPHGGAVVRRLTAFRLVP